MKGWERKKGGERGRDREKEKRKIDMSLTVRLRELT
jgi:hypothetical protein